MTRNSTRSYWMENKDWYRVVDGKPELTSVAPPEARRSFAEWNKPRKFNFKRLIRKIRTLFY
ncbi:MAG: hypothetical protein IJO60_01670 [Agathobacter sp.]|nr:hypothetical protein [Agathobacter sp.]